MWNRLSFNSSRNKENKILYSNGSIRSTFRKSSRSRYDEDSVSLLRSLYATLLAAIQVPPSLVVSQSNVSSSFLQEEEEEGLIIPCREETVEEEEEVKVVKGYTSSLVRNFRGEKKQSKKWHDDHNYHDNDNDNDNDDDEECEISFEIFHPESPVDAACISRIWRHLSATTTTVNNSYSNNNNNDKADFEMSEMEIAALILARQIEARVVELIRSIGELVVYGEQRSNLFTDFKQNNNKHSNSVNRKKKKYNHTQQCPSFHNGFVFEYFCDKNILALLVDIVTAKPSSQSSSSLLSSSSAFSTSSGQSYSGVVWTPLVKAQVLQTISIFISNVSDPKSLYYLLSNNYINRIISSIVPLAQWSTGALEEMLPVYISFLKSLALKLAKSPHLFQFFCHGDGSVYGDGDGDGDGDGEDGAKVYWLSSKFPLFGAAVEVASSLLPVAKDDTFVHTTALNILLHLCQMPQDDVRSMIGGECLEEQKRLVCHLCDEIVLRHNNLVDLLWLSFRMGQPCDNTQLHSVMMDEVAKLDDVLHFVNDLLWCSQRTVNARFCEYFMQYVMVGTVLEDLQRIQEQNKEKCKVVGTSTDCDNVEKEEKGEKEEGGDSVQNVTEQKVKFIAALLTLFRVFSVMDYAPLLKMIAIAFLHPNTPLRQQQQQQKSHGKDFVLTPALNAIAKNDFVVISSDTHNSDKIDVSKEEIAADIPQASSNNNSESKASQHVDVDRVIQAVPNINRYLIMESVSGALGERCFIMTSLLLQSILQSKAMDSRMYKVLKLVPTVDYDKENIHECKMHSLDVPLAKFFDDVQNISPSQEGSYSMDCAISLVILYLPHFIQALTEQETQHQDKTRMQHLDLFTNIRLAKESFASESLRLKGIDGLCDFFTILMEEEIQKLFSILDTSGPQIKFQCDLQTLSSEARNNILHILITNHKTLFTNKTHEINTARFVIRTLVILTSLYQNLIQVHTNLSAELLETSYSSLHDSIPSRWSHGFVNIEKISVASKDICSMGCLDRQSIVGTDYFIKDNKTHFSISPSLALTADGEEVSSVLLPSISWKSRNPSPPITTKTATIPTLPTIIDPEKTKRRALADKILMKSAFSKKTEMILVVDETELLILKSKIKNDVNNNNTKDKHETKVVGTILCTTLLSNIIAIAADDAWLHIAMRNVEDVGVLIRKGNMALRFQDKTTCFVAKKCIEESRDASIRILSSTVDMFLGRESDSSFS